MEFILTILEWQVTKVLVLESLKIRYDMTDISLSTINNLPLYRLLGGGGLGGLLGGGSS